MKKNFVLMCFLLMALLLFGCGNETEEKSTEEDTGTVVFKFGDIEVLKGEVYIYANTVKEKYESEYGKDVWGMDFDKESTSDKGMEELTREAIIAEIVRVKTFSLHAEEYDVRLSETDEKEITEKAHEFYGGLTDKDIEQMELSEELAYNVMKENMLEQKVKAAILTAEPVEISDEQARMTCFYDMYFPCFTVNAAGYVKPFSEEKRDEQRKAAIEACSKLATAELGDDTTAQDIEKLAEEYGLSESKEQTMSPEEIIEVYGQKIYDEIYKMKDGQYSTVLESEYGFHIFLMIEITAEDATAEKKAVMTEEAIKNLITDKEVMWRNEIDSEFAYPDSVNMDIYNSISIAN